MGHPLLVTPAAALPLRGLGCEAHEVSDQLLARLVHRRLELLRRQGWVAFGLFGGALLAVAFAAFIGPSQLVLGVAGTGVASLALGLGFCVDRAARWRFRSEARLCGLSDDAAQRVYQDAAAAEDMIEILRACGAEPSDQEVANFVR